MVVDYVVCRRKKLPEIDKYNREIIMIPPCSRRTIEDFYREAKKNQWIKE